MLIAQRQRVLLTLLVLSVLPGCEGEPVLPPEQEIPLTIAKTEACEGPLDPTCECFDTGEGPCDPGDDDPGSGNDGVTMDDWDAYVAGAEATAGITDWSVWAFAGYGDIGIPGRVRATTATRSLWPPFPVAYLVYSVWVDVEGEYSANGMTVPFDPPLRAWPGLAKTWEWPVPLDCDAVSTGWVRAESKHGDHWVVEVEIMGVRLDFSIDSGPKEADDREDCPDPDPDVGDGDNGGPGGGGGGGEGEGTEWCMVRYWFDEWGRVIKRQVLYCWTE